MRQGRTDRREEFKEAAVDAAIKCGDLAGKELKRFGIAAGESAMVSLYMACALLESGWRGVQGSWEGFKPRNRKETVPERGVRAFADFFVDSWDGLKDHYQGLVPHEQKRLWQGMGTLCATVVALQIWNANHPPSTSSLEGTQAAIPVATNVPDYGRRSDPPVRRSIDPSVAPMSNFTNPSQALVLCSNTEQYRLVVGSYQSDMKESFSGSISVRRLIPGKACIVTLGFQGETTASVPHLVVNTAELDNREIRALIRRAHMQSEFGIVFNRGHTDDMPDLLERGAEFEAAHCLRMLGGCDASTFIGQYHEPNKPLTGSTEYAYAPRNNFWAACIIKGLHITDTWEGLKSYVDEQSPLAREELVMPGTSQYDAFTTDTESIRAAEN